MTLSPFFIVMHLPKLPTIFVKDGEERKAYYTVQARELLAAGWKEKGEEKPEPKAASKPAPKAAPKAPAKAPEAEKSTAAPKEDKPKSTSSPEGSAK